MKSGFIILFLEIFGVQLCNFLLSVKSEIAYIFLLIQSFLLLFIYRHLYLLVKQSLKNAQQEAEFQSLQKQEQLQKDQEQLFISRRQETAGIPAGHDPESPDTSDLSEVQVNMIRSRTTFLLLQIISRRSVSTRSAMTA